MIQCGLAFAQALERIKQALQQELSFIPSLAQRTFNIAAGDLVEFSILPQLIEHIGQHTPGIVIRLNPVPEGDLAHQLLETGEIDAIISDKPLKAIHNERLAKVSLTTLIWKRENLRKRRFPLGLYLKRPHVVIRTPEQLGTIVDQTLARRGLRRQIGAVVQNFMAMPMIAARTGYICNIPNRMAETLADLFDLSVHEPPIDFTDTPLLMSWHKRFEADPAHSWLLEQIRSMVLPA